MSGLACNDASDLIRARGDDMEKGKVASLRQIDLEVDRPEAGRAFLLACFSKSRAVLPQVLAYLFGDTTQHFLVVIASGSVLTESMFDLSLGGNGMARAGNWSTDRQSRCLTCHGVGVGWLELVRKG